MLGRIKINVRQEYRINRSCAPAGTSVGPSNTHIGWTASGGEYPFTQN